ncbi:MAG: Smr/MutS family protein [Lachnospiraceae bacterium]|nr:Smr/MutS family protein [Lachnospiraceae bacterium]
MMSGIIEINVHGKNVEEAIDEIRKQLNSAKANVYRIRVIHGYRGGTRIRDGIWDEFSYGREPKVKRITMGNNQGITELVLRDF